MRSRLMVGSAATATALPAAIEHDGVAGAAVGVRAAVVTLGITQLPLAPPGMVSDLVPVTDVSLLPPRLLPLQ